MNLCKTNEELKNIIKKIYIFRGEKKIFFSSFFKFLLNTLEMKSIAKTNCEIHN